MNRPLKVDRLEALWGCPVFDRDGEKVGSLEDVFEEAENGEPGWLGVGTGLLGRRLVVVPGRGAIEIQHGVRVAYLSDDVQQAPELRQDELDAQTIRTLEAYYAPLTLPKQRAVTSSAG
jgi:PRC-barrel domain